MSDTPRTDALAKEASSLPECERIMIDFARALERELAAAQKNWSATIQAASEHEEVSDKRIAELERERNYLVNVLYKAREDCIEEHDCHAMTLLDKTCARYPPTGGTT